jgi:hypothetical protein
MRANKGRNRMKTLLMLGGLLASQATMADVDCFTIYGPRNQTVYRATTTPIDLSGSIGDEMRKRWPGHHLVWTKEQDCRVVNGALTTRADADAYSAELLSQSRLFANAAEVRQEPQGQREPLNPLGEARAQLDLRKAPGGSTGPRTARGAGRSG